MGIIDFNKEKEKKEKINKETEELDIFKDSLRVPGIIVLVDEEEDHDYDYYLMIDGDRYGVEFDVFDYETEQEIVFIPEGDDDDE